MEQKKWGLTGTDLKLIALVLMILDHIHYFFGFTGWIPEWFSMLGRLSAPLFLFCLVEGFTHTHNRKRYFLKVYGISIAMNGLLFFMQFAGLLRRGDGFFPMNGMMTAYTILMVIYQGIDWLGQKRWIRGLAAVLLPLIWPFLGNMLVIQFPRLANPVGFLAYTFLPIWNSNWDTSLTTIFLGIFLYVLRRHRLAQVSVFAVLNFLIFFLFTGMMMSRQPGFQWIQMFTDYYEWFGCFAGLLMLCYNGARGRGYQKLFYVFYPAHIYLLYALSCWVYNILN